MPARLTSIITLYNSARTIAETIDSLREQTFEDWECVVVDDGSTDNGPSIVEAIMKEEPRLRMVTQPNRGLPGARNRGIDECRTELVHFLDSDDWMTPRGLEWLVGAAAETGASYGGYELCDESGRSLGRQSQISVPMVGLDEQLEWNRTQTHAHLFSRASIGECRFDERCKVVEDYDMWLRLAARGERWKAVEQIVARYRVRPDSMSKQFDAMTECYEAAVRRAFVDAANLGWGDKIGLSVERMRRVVGTQALAFATMEALREHSPNKSKAAAIMHRALKPDQLELGWVANAANVGLLFGGAAVPGVDGYTDGDSLRSLRRWWMRCAEEGWFAFSSIDAAFAEFARKVVHPEELAATMLAGIASDRHRASPDVVVVGMEKNGRRLIRRAAGAGLRVIGLDDFSERGERELLSDEERRGWDDRVTLACNPDEVRRALKAASAAAWLVGPMEGRTLEAADRLVDAGASARVERWSEHRTMLGEANLQRIRRSMAHRPAMAG